MSSIEPQLSTRDRTALEPHEVKSGLPCAPDERRREIRAAINQHAEALRRLAS